MGQSPGEVCVGAKPNLLRARNRRDLLFRENVSNASLPEEEEMEIK